MYCICPHLTSGAALGCTTLAIKCTAEAILYLRSPTWVYCICQVYFRDNHIQYIRNPTWMYCISYHVHQEPRLGVLHLPAGALDLPSSVLHILSCKSGASLGILYLPHSCTAEAMLYFISPTWVHCICLKCTAYAIMYIRNLTWVHCIWHLVYCISIMYIGSLTWVYYICHQVYCICPHLTSGATLGYTTLAITWVYCSCHQVYCRDNHIQYIKSLTWVYCIYAIKCTAYAII